MKKCHPALFELAPLWKESIAAVQTLGPNARDRQAAVEIEQKLDSRLKEIHERYSGSTPPEPNTFPAQVIFRKGPSGSDAEAVVDWIHFERHRVPLGADLVRRQQNEWGATARVLRTVNDVEMLHCGKRIRPFKGNSEHEDMFLAFWGLGIEKLSPDELADFFDWYCPGKCGPHDPDALKKHRARFKVVMTSH